MVQHDDLKQSENSGIYCTRKFSPGEKFRHLLLLAKFLLHEFCPVLMITLRRWRPLLHWQKFIPPNISVHKVAGLGCPAKILLYMVIKDLRPFCQFFDHHI